MSKSLKWRTAVVVLVIFLALIYLTPSLTEDLPTWWPEMLPRDKIHLGLDLQGGMHLVLEVEVAKALENRLDRFVEELRHNLRESSIRYLKLERKGTGSVVLKLMREEDVNALKALISANYPDLEVTSAGESGDEPEFRLELSGKAKNRITKMAVDQGVQTIRNRIDQFGVREPDIRPQQNNRILVQLPGIEDPERAIDLIGRTALLEFKLVDEEHSVQEALEKGPPPGSEILYQSKIDPDTGRKQRIPWLVKERAPLTGEYLTDARVNIDSRYNEPYVSISFDSTGARIFEQITARNVGKRLAIVLDDKVYSAPVIQDEISGGRAQITGRFSMEEARDLAIVLRAGALPAPVKIIEKRTVGPSLGKDSIEKGFNSMLIGGAIVIVFMFVYYGLSGLIADFALLLNILFVMAGLAFFGATLTLPGIAGLILTIGMAVDANVLIFERIREELRLGKSPRASIEGGFAKALVTILDANVTTLIAALVLFQFGTGPVRGFAVTLSIGIVASLFTAIVVSRIIFDYLYVQRRLRKVHI